MGSALLGQLFDRLGWAACVTGIAAALGLAGLLAGLLRMGEPARLAAHVG